MKLKIIVAIVAIPFTTLLGLMSYDITRMDAETIILCASNEGGILVPSNACKYYLFNYRDIKKDIRELSDGSGLSFILNGDNDIKYEIAEYFISNGLDINGINQYSENKLTPIYGAILLNDVKMAKFLVHYGANLNLVPPSINMSVQEFNQYLQEKDPSIDRSTMISVLANR